MSNKKFDPNKPFQTVDGRPARLLEANYTSEYGTKLLVVLITNQFGREDLRLSSTDGRPLCSDDELENIPEPITITRYLAAIPSADYVLQCNKQHSLDLYLTEPERNGATKFRLDLTFLNGKFQSATVVEI